MNVVLRDIETSDAHFLFELYRETRKDEMAGWGWSPEQKVAFLRQQHNARHKGYAAQYPDALDSVILVEGDAVGRILVAELADELRLVDIAVMPPWQGKGIGTLLIKQLLESAKTSGKPVRLHVGVFNPARELYERLGFETIRETAGDFLMQSVACGVD